MFPPISTVFYEWEEDDTGMPVTDAHGNYIPVTGGDGEPVVANEVLFHSGGSLLTNFCDKEILHDDFTK